MICRCNPFEAYEADNYHYSEHVSGNATLHYITHPGLRNALEMFEHIERETETETKEYLQLVSNIFFEIHENRDPVSWCHANITPMLGDIFLLFIKMERDVFVKHECTVFLNPGSGRWDVLIATQKGMNLINLMPNKQT